jgi:murein DD-endopeptidase MepM/ murein hydrolase activator NlpD
MKKIIYMAALSCALSIPLAACGTQQAVSVQSYGEQKGAGSTGIHTVLPGETIYNIAQNYQLPVREVIALNKLNAPYNLVTGDRVKLPPPNEYRVRVGDTLGSIAALYEVSPSRLVELNNLRSPYTLVADQSLRLPTPTQQAIEAMNKAQPVQLARITPVDRAPTRIVTQAPVVQSAAPQINVPASSVNTPTTTIVTTAPATISPSRSPAIVTAPPQVNAQENVQEASASSQVEVPSEIPKRSGYGKFMTPVDGNVISSFGPKSDGLHNDGINILAVRGTPVRAAENGVVVYTGDDLEGYGNLVLVRHEGKLITAYAHLDKMLVKRGDEVKRGTSIGTVGDSGQVDRPQLHFEIRKGTKALNPDRYL